MAADVRRLDVQRGAGVAEVRAVRPGAEEFTSDLAWMLAERQTDLICLLGRGSRALVTELAELHPHLTFCAAPLPLNAEVPDPVQVLEIRGQELGHVVGLAAGVAAGGAPIGVVLGTEAMPRGAFRDGLVAAVEGLDVIQVTVDEELDAVEAVAQVLDEGAELVVIDSMAGAGEALQVAAEHALVLSPDVLVRGAAADQSILTWRVHWDVVLRRALDRLTGDVDASPVSYGFHEGAFTISTGPAAPVSLERLLDRIVAEMEDGRRDPLEPPEELQNGDDELDLLPRLRPPDPDDDDDDDDDDDEDDDGDADGDGGEQEPAEDVEAEA
jgi:hypothetical protein